MLFVKFKLADLAFKVRVLIYKQKAGDWRSENLPVLPRRVKSSKMILMAMSQEIDEVREIILRELEVVDLYI